jgi:hypothetical protein
MCNICYECRHLFSVLTSGPMTVNAQRGTCHMSTGCEVPGVKTEKCMHKYHLNMYLVNIFVIWKKRHLTEKIIPNLTLLYIEINIEITFQEDNLIKSKSLNMCLYCMTCFIVLYLCNFIMHVLRAYVVLL